MPTPYAVIEVFTSERPGAKGRSAAGEIVRTVASMKIPARTIVFRGSSGSFESGEVASAALEVLSFALPVKVEIVLPERHLQAVLSAVEPLVEDGVVLVRRTDVSCHSIESRLVPRHLTVGEVMTPDPVSVSTEVSIRDAVKLLSRSPFHALPVVDGDQKPVGILTQGDLIRRGGLPLRVGLLAELEAEPAAEILGSLSGPVRDAMTAPLICVRGTDRLSSAVTLLLEKNLKRLPVVDANDRLAGMLARVDIIRAMTSTSPDWNSLAREEIRVEGVELVRDVVLQRGGSVREDASVEEAIRILAATGSQRLAVLDSEGRLAGIISDRDVLSRLMGGRRSLWRTLSTKLGLGATEVQANLEGPRATAASVMTRNPVCVTPETSVQTALKMMLDGGLKRLPVVDAERRLLGMISRDALLRCATARDRARA